MPTRRVSVTISLRICSFIPELAVGINGGRGFISELRAHMRPGGVQSDVEQAGIYNSGRSDTPIASTKTRNIFTGIGQVVKVAWAQTGLKPSLWHRITYIDSLAGVVS